MNLDFGECELATASVVVVEEYSKVLDGFGKRIVVAEQGDLGGGVPVIVVDRNGFVGVC